MELTPSKSFKTAVILINQEDKVMVSNGITILKGLLETELSDDDQRKCVYYLCIAHIKLGDYILARRYVNILQNLAPDNQKVQNLKESLDKQVTQDGIVGAITVAALLTTLGAGLLFITRKMSARQ